MQEASFDLAGEITFTEKKVRGLKPERLQAGMFMDRADLWKRRKRRRGKRVGPEQSKMFDDPAHIYLGRPAACKLEGERETNV